MCASGHIKQTSLLSLWIPRQSASLSRQLQRLQGILLMSHPQVLLHNPLDQLLQAQDCP